MNVRGDFLGPPHGTTTRGAVCGKKGYNLSSTQSMVLFHVELEFRIVFIAELYPIRNKGKYYHKSNMTQTIQQIH